MLSIIYFLAKLYMNTFNISDKIGNAKKNNLNVEEKKYEEKYNRAKEIIENKLIITSNKKNIEYEKNNTIINNAILGDKGSIALLTNLIIKYLTESDEFSIDEITDLSEKIYENNFGLGPLTKLVNDKTINEILVNGKDQIWIEKQGEKIRLQEAFKSNDDIIRIMNQMLQYDQKEINLSNPAVESKLMDGSRITFSIPPISSVPCMNIRKFEAFEVSEKEMIEVGTLTKEMADFFKILVQGRANIIVIGETGAGKTCLLQLLYGYVNPNLRIVSIEKDRELRLKEKYPERSIVEYEEHKELGISLGDLFVLSLRTSPDIIWLGEARESREASLLIDSMRRGHKGSVGSLHITDEETAVEDIFEIISSDSKERDARLTINRIAEAVNIVIKIHKCEDKVRRIVKVVEIIPVKDNYFNKEGRIYNVNPLWEYNKKCNTFNNLNGIKGDKLLKSLSFYGVEDVEIEKIKDERV